MIKEEKSVFEPEIPTVPAGWEVAPFDLVVTTVSDEGKRIKQRDYLVQGNIPVIDQGQDFIGGYTNDESLAFEGKLPVVLFGDHTRTVKFVDKRFAVGAEGVKVFQSTNCYAPKFFYYLLTSLQIPSRGYSRHFQFLKKFALPLAPLNEQTRIVAEIEKQFSRLDEAVANLKRVKANLKRYKAAVLKAAVEGKLTEEWRQLHPDVEPADKLLARILVERRKAAGKGKYKEPVGPETADLPELPAGWVWASAVQACDPVVDCHNKTAPYTESGIPLVRTSNIRDGRLLLEEVRFVDQPTYDFWSKRCPPEPGDVLFTREAPMGEAAIVPPGVKLCMGQRMMLLRPSAGISSPFLLVALMSPVIKRLIELTAVGSGVKHMRVGDVELLPIPLPSRDEQDEIVAEVERRLSIVAGAEAQVDVNLCRADRLRQSILKQAFSGQLVPQDPNDEPASMLLERIRNGVGRNGVGAIHESPAVVPRKPNRAIHESPLRKSKPQPVPASAASADFACLDDVTAAILGRMQPGREYACVELADPLGLSPGRWNAAIQDLKRIGKVRQVGEKRGARYVLISKNNPVGGGS